MWCLMEIEYWDDEAWLSQMPQKAHLTRARELHTSSLHYWRIGSLARLYSKGLDSTQEAYCPTFRCHSVNPHPAARLPVKSWQTGSTFI